MSVVSGADLDVQAVSPRVALSHPPDGKLPLFSTRPAVTFPDEECHCLLASTKLYCLVTEAYGVSGLELMIIESPVRCLSH